jgi:hypothetical protein
MGIVIGFLLGKTKPKKRPCQGAGGASSGSPTQNAKQDPAGGDWSDSRNKGHC